MEKKRIGIVGIGGIAVSRHIREMENVQGCVVTALCDVDESKLAKWGEKFGVPEDHRFTDYHDLCKCEDVDAVEVFTPNHLHVPIAAAAVKAGKAIHVEKPLSTNLAATKPLTDALEENPVLNMMSFTYRFMPAVRYAKWIIDKGLLGDIVSVDVAYLKDSAYIAGRPLEWRFVKEYAGTGVLGDLGVHLIDMAELLTGKILEVSAVTDIIVKKRKRLNSDEYGDVETDDYCSFLANMENGVHGNFVVTRCALGQKNTIKFDIYGSKGVISFNLNKPDELGVCVGEIDYMTKSLHTVKVPKQFFITQEQAFIDLLHGKVCDFLPTVADGVRSQRILDALEESAAEKRWVTV